MSRKNKQIPFSEKNERDMRLFKYVENVDIPFASYVKNLIEKDMLKNENEKIDKNELKEILSEMDIKESKDKKDTKVTKTQKNSIKGILGNLK